MWLMATMDSTELEHCIVTKFFGQGWIAFTTSVHRGERQKRNSKLTTPVTQGERGQQDPLIFCHVTCPELQLPDLAHVMLQSDQSRSLRVWGLTVSL